MSWDIEFSGLSDIGLVRSKNEDAWAKVPDREFYILADGMGGHNAGGVAAKDAVSLLCNCFRDYSYDILEDFITEKLGEEMLEEIYEKVKLTDGVPPFVGPISYPDENIINILDFLSKKTGKSIEELLYTFGIYVIPVFAKKYPIFFENKSSSKDFLSTINDIHYIEVKKLYDDAFPPSLIMEDTGDGQTILHYQSKRKLCDLLKGLIQGVADYYKEEISYRHIQCMKEGAEECIFELNFI